MNGKKMKDMKCCDPELMRDGATKYLGHFAKQAYLNEGHNTMNCPEGVSPAACKAAQEKYAAELEKEDEHSSKLGRELGNSFASYAGKSK